MPHIKQVFPVLALSIFSSSLGFGIIAPLLPLYAENMGANGIWLAIIFGSFSFSQVIINPFAGKLSDRRGRKQLLAIGLFVYTVTSISYVWADSIASLILVRIIHGIASGIVFPIAQAYIGDIAPKDEEGKWMSYYNMALFTGFGFGPLMGGILAEQFGMDFAFYTMGFFNLIAFLAVSLFLPEIRHREKVTGSRASFQEIAASNTMRGIFSFQLGSASARGVFSTFLPVFAGIYLGLSTSLIGVLLTIQILGASLLQVPSGKMADRKIADGLNRRVLVVLGSFVSLTAYGLIPSAGSFWILVAICIILSLGDATTMPAVAAMTVTEGRKFGMGATMATYNMTFNVGMILGPILAGVIADSFDVNYVFYFGAVFVFAGVIAFGLFTRNMHVPG